jgi:lysophospholipase L1-like esterase
MKKIAIFLFLAFVFFLGYRLFFPAPKIKNIHPLGKNIICFSDSLTFGTGTKEGMDYPSKLFRMLSKPTIKAGIPGDTTVPALARLQKDILWQSPQIVLFTPRGNGLKNRFYKDEAFANLRKIIQSIEYQGALVVVGDIDIPFFGRGFGSAYGELCRERGAILIPNLYNGLTNHPDLMSDPIHPNKAGYSIITKYLYEAIKHCCLQEKGT